MARIVVLGAGISGHTAALHLRRLLPREHEVVVALLLGGLVLTAIARRIGAPYPALMALAGAALALVPAVPEVVLDPELALALFVAPVLVDAAFDASPRDLRANWRPVASLALGAVALTILVTALVTRALLPGFPWAAAIALGAIVAPPDAAAATTVLKALRPPHRLLVILEGESLFNDASALLTYRLAVGATMTGVLSGWSILPTLLVVTAGSVALGLALSWLTLRIMGRIHDVASATVLQFCSTFGVWHLAERLHLSGIITLVVYAMAASRRAPEVMPARVRIPSFAVWEVAVFVLNVLAFILVGFQLKAINARLTRLELVHYATVAAAITLAVIVARIAWVTAAAAVSRWRCRPRPGARPARHDVVALSARGAAVVGWCGMRGTVTLAAALALPAGFPSRDLVVVAAFGVVLGTLVLQGLTLRPLLLRLALEDDDTVGRRSAWPGGDAPRRHHRRRGLSRGGGRAPGPAPLRAAAPPRRGGPGPRGRLGPRHRARPGGRRAGRRRGRGARRHRCPAAAPGGAPRRRHHR